MCLLATLEFESGLYLYPQIQYYIYSSSLSASESDFRMYYSHCLLVTNELLLHLDFSILGCAFCATFGTDFLVSENVTNYQNVWHILISTNLHCRMDSSLSLNISLSFTFDTIQDHSATCVSVLAMWLHLLNFVQHPILTQMVF